MITKQTQVFVAIAFFILINLISVGIVTGCNKKTIPQKEELGVSLIEGADGFHYTLFKAEKKLPGGLVEIEEYIRLGDTNASPQRYGKMLNADKSQTPIFWRIR